MSHLQTEQRNYYSTLDVYREQARGAQIENEMGRRAEGLERRVEIANREGGERGAAKA